MIDRMMENKAEDMCAPLFGDDPKKLKKLIAAQTDAEEKGYGKNLPKIRLEELGYDVENFVYPQVWDTWPKEWDKEADPGELA